MANDSPREYLILLYFRGTLISQKFSRQFSRVFIFTIGEENCVYRELNFAKVMIQSIFFLFYKNYVNQQLQQNQYAAPTRQLYSSKSQSYRNEKSVVLPSHRVSRVSLHVRCRRSQ